MFPRSAALIRRQAEAGTAGPNGRLPDVWAVGRIRVLFLALSGIAMGFGTLAGSPADPERPNLVFLLSDDQRWDTLGAMGNPVIETPHLDRLAAEGVLFRNAFVTTPICAVSRASILSGQYAHRHGIRDFTSAFSPSALSQTYPLLLRAAGYYSGFIGKWGIATRDLESIAAVRQHFDFWAGFSHQGNYWHDAGCRWLVHNYLDPTASDACDCPPDSSGRAGPEVRVKCNGIDDPVHLTTQIIPEKVAQFLDTRSPRQPFALSVSFKAPHAPWQDWDPRMSPYYANSDEIPVPASLDAGSTAGFLLQSIMALPSRLYQDPAVIQKSLCHYYRQITGMDLAIGRIRGILAERRLDHNTVILCASDNGHLIGEHGLFGKSLMYEESIRVPLMVYDPRLPAHHRGSERDQMVLNIDVAPTLLELAGCPSPRRCRAGAWCRCSPDRSSSCGTPGSMSTSSSPRARATSSPPRESAPGGGITSATSSRILPTRSSTTWSPTLGRSAISLSLPEHRGSLERLRRRYQELRADG